MDHEKTARLVRVFEQNFGGTEGLKCSRAPGRVNLIGEHTDYNGGFVMPMAVDRDVRILFRAASGGSVRLWSENYVEWDEFDLDDVGHNHQQPWSNYLRGVAHMLQEAGHELRPIEALVFGDVPIGAGLSSSAAVEVATAFAFAAASGLEIESRELALLCQRAENQFVGVNCGIMDQYVSIHAQARHALLLDCRSLEHRQLPLDTSAFRIVVCNTMVHHELGSSGYNERRASCERAAELLNERLGGVEMLRDVPVDALEANAGLLDEVTYRRARHVVTEDQRTGHAAQALEEGDYALFGEMMYGSHASLRDDYEVSCEELDIMVELARKQTGIIGARMVGGGFGGCTVNLVRAEASAAFMVAMQRGYREETGIEPEVYEFVAVDGAGVSAC